MTLDFKLRRGLIVSGLLLSACAVQPPLNDFAPGLGEIMAQTANRHVKLWFAGEAGNWELAAYELDELHEGFEDAAKFHPTHKDIKQPIAEMIAQTMDQPLSAIEQAVQTSDTKAFNAGYDQLTAACNACHQMSGFGFNRVVKPTFNPFANQAFGRAN